jgi:ribosome-binding factor A
MPQGTRPARVGEGIRQELGQMLARDVHDPGVGFVTITRVTVSPDLQVARVYYTQMGDERARKDTTRALERATPFLRRQLGARLRLRRVPELHFHFDQSVENQERIERILLDLESERRTRAAAGPDPGEPAGPDAPDTDQTGDGGDPDGDDEVPS